MRLVSRLDVDVAPSSLFAWVDDLERYPDWLGLVRSVRREPPAPEDVAAPHPGPPAWDVVLIGRLGPLRRLKRLRMVRASHEVDGSGRSRATFLRAEHDGARHATWELAVEVVGRPGGAGLTMQLHYGGTLWAPPLQRLLDHEIEAAKPRLAALARGGVAAS